MYPHPLLRFLVVLALASIGPWALPSAQAKPFRALLVSSGENDSVLLYDAKKGKFIETFASGGGLDDPEGLAFGPDGHLYVTSRSNAVLRYDGKTGAFIDIFASGGGLEDPAGLVFGADGNLYVSSGETDEVLRFDGVTGASSISSSRQAAALDSPEGLVFGPDGHLYVNSEHTSQVLRYDGATGAFIDVFASGGGLDTPLDLLFGPDGNLYVTSEGTDEVLRYDGTTGAFIDVFASGGGIDEPEGLGFGPDGNLYVVSEGTDEVFCYDGGTGAFIDSSSRKAAAGSGSPRSCCLCQSDGAGDPALSQPIWGEGENRLATGKPRSSRLLSTNSP